MGEEAAMMGEAAVEERGHHWGWRGRRHEGKRRGLVEVGRGCCGGAERLLLGGREATVKGSRWGGLH